jgi:hypothetical protein
MTDAVQNPPSSSPAPFPPNPPKAKSLWLRRILTLSLAGFIFFSGAILGAAITVKIIRNRLSEAVQHPEKGRERFVGMLTRKLKLDSDQQSKIDAIVEARQKEIMNIRFEIQPRVEAVLERGKTEIDAVLKPEQTDKWNKIVEDSRKKWRPPAPEKKD